MLTVIHKEYIYDIKEFNKVQKIIDFRRSKFGKLSYYFGKVVAIYYIIKMCLASKQIVQPVY
jgi:hypothetical protein